MSWLAAAAVGGQVAGTIAGAFGSKSAADAKKDAARKNANFTFRQRMEEIRRSERDMAYTEGAALASAGGSNIAFTGSTKRYIDDLRNEHRRQISYAQTNAVEERKMIRAGGKSPGLTAGIIGQAASGLASAASTYKTVSS